MRFTPRLAALAAILALPLGAALASTALSDDTQPTAPAGVRIGGTDDSRDAPPQPAGQAGPESPAPAQEPAVVNPPAVQPAPQTPQRIKTQVVPPAPPVSDPDDDDGGGDDGGGDG